MIISCGKGTVPERGDGWHLEVSPDALEAAIPASLVGTVARELEELAPDERQAIEAASVVGIEFSLWLAAHAADIDELALEPVLEMLARRRTFIVREGVVELANGRLQPALPLPHGLYQEIVLDRTPATRAWTRTRARGSRSSACSPDASTRPPPIWRAISTAPATTCAPRDTSGWRPATRFKRYAPREAAALLHGAVTHAAHLGRDERARVEMPLMLELGQAQLAAGETDARHPDADAARATRRRRAPSRRSASGAAGARRGARRQSLARPRSTCARQIKAVSPFATDTTLAATAAIRAGLIELYFDGWSDEIADRCLETWRDLPRDVHDEHRSLAIRLLFLQTSRSAYASAVDRRTKTAAPRARERRRGGLRLLLLPAGRRRPASRALGRRADARGRGNGLCERTGSTRYAVTMRMLRRGSRSKGQRFDEASRLSVADRPLVETGGWANARQMSLLFGGAVGARARPARRRRRTTSSACATGMPASGS